MKREVRQLSDSTARKAHLLLVVKLHLKELVCVLRITFTPISLFSEQRQVQLGQQCAITVQCLLAEFSRHHVLLIGLVADSLGVGSEEVDQLVQQRLSLHQLADYVSGC